MELNPAIAAGYFAFALSHAGLLGIIERALAEAAGADLDDAARRSADRWRERVIPMVGRDVAGVRRGAVEVTQADYARASHLGEVYSALSKDLEDNFVYNMQWAGPDGEQVVVAAIGAVVRAASRLLRLTSAGAGAVRGFEVRYGYLPEGARGVELQLYRVLGSVGALLALRAGDPSRGGPLAAADPVVLSASEFRTVLARILADPAPGPDSAVALPRTGSSLSPGDVRSAVEGPAARLRDALPRRETTPAEAHAAQQTRAELERLLSVVRGGT